MNCSKIKSAFGNDLTASSNRMPHPTVNLDKLLDTKPKESLRCEMNKILYIFHFLVLRFFITVSNYFPEL